MMSSVLHDFPGLSVNLYVYTLRTFRSEGAHVCLFVECFLHAGRIRTRR